MDYEVSRGRVLLYSVAIGVFFLFWTSPFAVASVPEKWETTGAMSTARYRHTAISLPYGSDDRTLIVGGMSPSGLLASAELYSASSGNFGPTGSMGTARADHTASFFWGQVLIAGGTGPSGPLDSAELYDTDSGTFSPTTEPMGTARAHHTASVVFGPAVLIAGGTGPSGPLDSAELYSAILGTFSFTTGSMQAARADHTATSLSDGMVLIAGGNGPSGPLASAELYNPMAKTFVLTAGPMGTARADHTATNLPNGMILIAGGNGPTGPLASAELYDPQTGTFSPTNGSMGTARSHHTATLLPDGKVLIAGGTGPGGPLDTTELYDPGTGTFSATLPMGSVKEQHTASLLVNGKVLIAGGTGPSGPTSSAELYSPSIHFNWQFVGPSAYLVFLKIRVDPENENLWYAATQSSGIFITRDSGTNWEQHLTGTVKALEIDPYNHSVVYASSGSDLYRSIDQGHTWFLVHSFPAIISDESKSPVDSPTAIDSILISSVNYGDIYIGLASTFHHGRVYKSSDGGDTWEISYDSDNGLHIWDIEEDPINGYLYFCTEDPSHITNALVMRSENRGVSWTDISPLQSTFGHGLKIQVHPTTQDVYFLTESQRVLYKSGDFGDTWTGKNVDINCDLIIDKNYPDRFFGATIVSGTYVGGVYFSEDTGESFDFGGLAGTTSSLALNGTSTKLYAATAGRIHVAYISETPPTVTSTDPAGNATNVPVNSLISATFSGEMDAATINATTFTLSGGITGTVAYDSNTRTATFTPSQNLALATPYTATITTGVADLAGNPMASNYAWSFTTADLPDLTGSWMRFVPEGGRMNVGILRVGNIGSQNAKSFSVAFYLSDDGRGLGRLLQTTTVRGLRTGSYISIPLRILFLLGQSSRYVIAVIDPDNQVAEANEKNNTIPHQIR